MAKSSLSIVPSGMAQVYSNSISHVFYAKGMYDFGILSFDTTFTHSQYWKCQWGNLNGFFYRTI
jgi:hypothetical protein